MKPYRIKLDSSLPVHDPVFGWRRLTSWLFGWPRRGRMVIVGPGQTLTTHPDNASYVRAFLTARGLRYETAALAEVRSITPETKQ